MFAFVEWYIKLLTTLLSWGSFLFIGITGTALLLEQKCKVLGCCCVGYAVAFLIVRFFFSAIYFQCMPGTAIFLAIVCTIRSRYEDRVNGKRWWNW